MNMVQNDQPYEQILAELKSHSSFYENLPFNTGDFLLIANYKLIGTYRQLMHLRQNAPREQDNPEAYAQKRKALHEEVLFQLDKALSLSSLAENETEERLRTYKILHEKLLQAITI